MDCAVIRRSCSVLALIVLSLRLTQAQQKTLDIQPVFQTTGVYCWLATGQMVFQHFGIPANDPTIFSADDPRDYQCGEAKGIGAVRTGIPSGPQAYMGQCWNNCAMPWCMTSAGSLQGIYNLITQYPQIVARTNGNTNFFQHPIEVATALTREQVRTEIDNGRPIIAGISPGMQYLPPGVSEHAVLIVGYADGGATLIVNDPFPYQTQGKMPSYLQVGGQSVIPGRFRVPFVGMVGFIAWRNTIYNLQTGDGSTPGQVLPGPDTNKLSCKIDSTSFPWNPPGDVQVRVDGKSVGSFDFGPGGSSSLDFDCKAGHHHFQFAVSGPVPSSCSGAFDVDEDNTSFTPQINVSPFGQVSCSLHSSN